MGAYCFDQQVWDIIQGLEPSPRGEHEITAVNNEYIRRKALKYDIVEGGLDRCRHIRELGRGQCHDACLQQPHHRNPTMRAILVIEGDILDNPSTC